MNAGDIAQHLKVGKARLLKKIDSDSHGTEKWEVQFITGPHRNKGPLNIWIKETNIVERAEVIETVEVAPVIEEAPEVAVEAEKYTEHVVSLTPNMIEVLAVHRTASESLDEAYAAGMLVSAFMGRAVIPGSALPALLRFTGMRAELAQENFKPGASSYQREEWRAEIALHELVKSL